MKKTLLASLFLIALLIFPALGEGLPTASRSEERRVGKEC